MCHVNLPFCDVIVLPAWAYHVTDGDYITWEYWSIFVTFLLSELAIYL